MQPLFRSLLITCTKLEVVTLIKVKLKTDDRYSFKLIYLSN
jgi:hypothetical protein